MADATAWCNGKIGTKGLSYAAHTQAALASLNPPGLAAMFLDCGGFSNAFRTGIRHGGAFELKQATWAFNNGKASPAALSDPLIAKAMDTIDIRDWFTRMPWKRGHSPLQWVPEYEDYLIEQWTHGEFSDYWRQAGIYAEGFYDQYADVPMVHLSAWYDPYTRTATDNYTGLARRKRGPVRLILGPWTHGDRSSTYAGDVDFGPAATLDGSLAEDFHVLRLRWFDRWLRGIENSVDSEPTVRYFVMGGGSGRRNADGRMDHGGRWREAADWPLPNAVSTPFYCHADGALSASAPAAEQASLFLQLRPAQPRADHRRTDLPPACR
ncbi:MAG: CocE/NonD family hydrolase [Dehalococcoidia bacterium]